MIEFPTYRETEPGLQACFFMNLIPWTGIKKIYRMWKKIKL